MFSNILAKSWLETQGLLQTVHQSSHRNFPLSKQTVCPSKSSMKKTLSRFNTTEGSYSQTTYLPGHALKEGDEMHKGVLTDISTSFWTNRLPVDGKFSPFSILPQPFHAPKRCFRTSAHQQLIQNLDTRDSKPLFLTKHVSQLHHFQGYHNSKGVPLGCVLSPLLFGLLTYAECGMCWTPTSVL